VPGIGPEVDLDVVHEDVTPLATFKVPGLIWTGAATATFQNLNNWDALAEPTANDDVLFDTPIVAQGPTVVLDGNATARSIYFADDYTITGSAGTSLSLSVGRIDVDAGKTATISAVLAGSSGFHKVGNGTLVITGGNSTMTGASTISGGVVSIDTQSRLAPGIGSITIDNGATLRETNPGNGGSFVNAAIGLIIGPSGVATVEYTTSNSATIYQGTITAIGGTTSNGGSGTLVKTGPGEFRYQNSGTANSTFKRLVVLGGSFRLGSVTGANFETGFGAAPLAYLPDAITLDNGGAIGASFPVTLDSNRGITLAANGGTLDGVFAALSVPSPIVGSGSLSVKGSVTLSAANSYTGDTSVGNSSNTTTLTISSPANLGGPANTIVFNQGTLRTTASMNLGRDITVNTGVGTFDTSVNAVAAGTVEGVGALTKAGAGILAVTHLRLTPAPLGAAGGNVNVTGGTLQIGPSGGNALGVSRIGNLALLGGRLDLTDNKLITTGSLAQTTTQIQQGRNGGTWDGSIGIITALADGNFTTVGVASAAQVKGIASSQTATWAGQTVTGSDTLVMYTYGGDANLDGKINVDDYGHIDSSVPLGISGWFNGDFNYDGKVNVDDYGIIDFNVSIQGAPFFNAARPVDRPATAVPEPAGLLVIFTSSLIFSRRSRRRR
jgi:autotransporter-associated beta strand protein